MARRSFLDTNVLIYSVDGADSAKQGAALGVIERHARGKTGVISTQVLQEFYSAATRKLGIEPLEARRIVRDFRIFDIVQVTPEIIEEGIDCSILNTISFWDGLIVVSASTARCSEILSEDLADGQTIQGVSVRNPFRSGSFQ
jgi:predicted nucleic acid-binding protein